MRSHELGRAGENLAARHLERRGWRIVERNVRFGHKEIDLIAAKGDVIAFVEVKSRVGAEFGHPLAAITQRKRSEIRAVASEWLRRAHPGAVTLRFDAVSVLFRRNESPIIEHVEDAWRLSERFSHRLR